ncbi:phosphoribosyltransferase [Streptomyces roseoverticillatus]|uniref:phosphoribosyltransferase n=1 Tax=Streptomyces roseoverticillatus TaxID=66429 RepID=UPI0033F57054
MNAAHTVDRADLPLDDRCTVENYERHYGTRFGHLLRFDSQLLKTLHGPGELPGNVRVASAERPGVTEQLAVVTAVANLPEQRDADRRRYLRALLDIYGMLPSQPADRVSAPRTTVIAPEREGRILAELLHVLPHRNSLRPQVKRMPAGGGLLVGVDQQPPARAERVVIVDGVVASGVTLMAMMHLTARPGTAVEVFTCHATPEGALALARYAEQLKVSLTLHAGHVSGILNEKYYSVEPGDQATLLLGDIGDTISPVVPPSPQGKAV